MFKLTKWNRLSKEISWVVSGPDLLYLYPLVSTQEMIPDINVLGPIMVHLIFSLANGT